LHEEDENGDYEDGNGDYGDENGDVNDVDDDDGGIICIVKKVILQASYANVPHGRYPLPSVYVQKPPKRGQVCRMRVKDR